jgi:hypothetical protein
MNRTRVKEARLGAIRVPELEPTLSNRGIEFAEDVAGDKYYTCVEIGDIIHFYRDGTWHADKALECRTPQEYIEMIDRMHAMKPGR